jgi:hypothetical protein
MSKKSITLECNDCLNTCTVQGKNVDAVQFCPFCGEGILMAYDDIDDDELFGTDYDDEVSNDVEDDE